MPNPSGDTRLYVVHVYTGNSFMAGTDANVYMKMYGSEGDSAEFRLHNENVWDQFDAGKVDVFRVRCKNIGLIHRVAVRHDNGGKWPNWFLSKIVVVEEASQREATFPCNRWLSQDSHDARTTLYLDADVIPVTFLDPLHEQNRPAHHTEKYHGNSLVVRRGQPFLLDLHLARSFLPKKDLFFLVLVTGSKPRQHNKTFVFIPKVDEFDDLQQEWGFRVLKHTGRVVHLEVNCPSDALVAKYKLIVDSDTRTVLEYEEPLYILFNPWNKHDEVYMEDEAWLREYILAQHGTVYVGSKNCITPRNWYFGQFEGVSLKCIFQVLHDSEGEKRETAAQISRILSARVASLFLLMAGIQAFLRSGWKDVASVVIERRTIVGNIFSVVIGNHMMNSNDDNGILVGNWSGNYHDGKEPTFWTSSPAIFEEYMASNTQTPVKYGQCWVFSAILTSALRTIGIPARCVTNFNSAHDTNKNASFDIFLDEDGSVMEHTTKDSIWNFHCWNDAWMARPDLPPGYGGWQALDATPQELSRGIFRTGPAPLRAIKEGKVNVDFDTGFVLAEVNSDVIVWQKNPESKEWEVVNSKREHIGRNISTKAVGEYQREDITNAYKFPEGSVLERASVRKALALSHNYMVRSMPKDLDMIVNPKRPAIMVGEAVVLAIELRNRGPRTLTVKVIVGGHVVRYNGVAKAGIERLTNTVAVKPMSNQVATLSIEPSYYLQHLSEMTMLRFYISGTVAETGQICLSEKLIDIKKPDIVFENLPGKARYEKEMGFQVAFENPLGTELTNCQIHFDGTMMKERISIKNGTVPPRQKFVVPVKLIPNANKGKKSLLVTFNSRELAGLHAFTKVLVE